MTTDCLKGERQELSRIISTNRTKTFSLFARFASLQSCSCFIPALCLTTWRAAGRYYMILKGDEETLQGTLYSKNSPAISAPLLQRVIYCLMTGLCKRHRKPFSPKYCRRGGRNSGDSCSPVQTNKAWQVPAKNWYGRIRIRETSGINILLAGLKWYDAYKKNRLIRSACTAAG